MLVDYMRIDLLHKFLDNSTKDLLNIFKTHIRYTPTIETLQTKETDKVFAIVRSLDSPETPLFPLTLSIYLECLTIDPQLKVSLDILHQLTDLWYVNSISMKSFIEDAIFKPFTKYVLDGVRLKFSIFTFFFGVSSFVSPMINGKIEDRLCGSGPSLVFYLEEDHELEELKQEIFVIIEDAYSAVDIYIQRFENVRQFYVEDCAMETETIEYERGVAIK